MPSLFPLTIRLPSGLKATFMPVSVNVSSPVLESHTLSVLFQSPLAMRLPSGENVNGRDMVGMIPQCLQFLAILGIPKLDGLIGCWHLRCVCHQG